MEWAAFWTITLALFIFIPLLMIWMFAIVDLFGRADIGGFGKVLWLLAIIFLPILGTVIYFLVLPRDSSYVREPRSTSDSTGGQSSSS